MAVMDYPFLIIGITHLLGLMAPGPDMAMLIRNSTRLPARLVLWGPLGLSCGILVHTVLALTGISALLDEFPWIKNLVQIAGGCYLLWLGYQVLRESYRYRIMMADPAVSTETTRIDESPWVIWRQGFFNNILNPKALIYFVSILASVVTPTTSDVFKCLLGVEIFLIALAWFCLFSLLLNTPAMQAKLQQARGVILSLTGGVFVVFGGSILTAGILGSLKLWG